MRRKNDAKNKSRLHRKPIRRCNLRPKLHFSSFLLVAQHFFHTFPSNSALPNQLDFSFLFLDLLLGMCFPSFCLFAKMIAFFPIFCLFVKCFCFLVYLFADLMLFFHFLEPKFLWIHDFIFFCCCC